MVIVANGITSEVRLLAGKAPAHRMAGGPRLMKSLVLSGDSGLRGRLEAVTELCGWSSCDATDDRGVLQSVVDSDYQLVIADIAKPLGDRVNDTVEIVEEFAARPGTLVVVCGPEDGVDEELWARQIGVWVYLPGVVRGDALVDLFTEAHRLASRRREFEFV